tara:strand:+ start:124 stop:795 length:672 start_codon:yes stop_codon:yes gene_type:complete
MDDFIRPFGPTIYRGRLSDEEIIYIQSVADETLKANKRIGKSLVGIMKDHMEAHVADHPKFLSILTPHIVKYAKYENDRRNALTFKGDGIVQYEGEIDWDSFTFNLGKGPWINFQKAGEYQPCHEHVGEISSVVYIDMPPEIAKEEYTEDTNINCPGQIEFLYGSGDIGSTGTQKLIPVTGDILLFPSGLKHIAYPFHTKDVTRISMSFNVFDWSVKGKKNKG